jgi:hypothetical protein
MNQLKGKHTSPHFTSTLQHELMYPHNIPKHNHTLKSITMLKKHNAYLAFMNKTLKSPKNTNKLPSHIHLLSNNTQSAI